MAKFKIFIYPFTFWTIFMLKITKSRLQQPLLDTSNPWSPYEMSCLNITTPPPFTLYSPNDRVLISWTLQCHEFLPKNFTLSFHNNPRANGFITVHEKSD